MAKKVTIERKPPVLRNFEYVIDGDSPSAKKVKVFINGVDVTSKVTSIILVGEAWR